MKIDKKSLNIPIIVLGLASASSVSYYNSTYDYCEIRDYSLANSDNFSFLNDDDINSYKLLEEDTTINNRCLVESNIYNDANEKYLIKSSPKTFIDDASEFFGEMTYLSAEGQEEYNNILDDIFEDSDIKLFDFI